MKSIQEDGIGLEDESFHTRVMPKVFSRDHENLFIYKKKTTTTFQNTLH